MIPGFNFILLKETLKESRRDSLESLTPHFSHPPAVAPQFRESVHLETEHCKWGTYIELCCPVRAERRAKPYMTDTQLLSQ